MQSEVLYQYLLTHLDYLFFPFRQCVQRCSVIVTCHSFFYTFFLTVNRNVYTNIAAFDKMVFEDRSFFPFKKTPPKLSGN